jgi:hypothetical protein
MSIIVVAGSDSTTSFSVIEFTGTAAANVILVPLGFGGCQLDLDGTDVAVGNSQGSQIRLYDVSNPPSPVLLGEFDSALSGIGAIKISNRRVAAGELNNTYEARVVLIDFSTPSSPVSLGMASTPLLSAPGGTAKGAPDVGSPTAISSVALASDILVFAAGPNNTEVVRIDFSTPGNPVVTSLPQTGLQGAPTVDADSLLLVAVGDGDGSSVRVFNANTWAVVASITTGLFPVTSVAISGQLALAASQEDSRVATVPIDGSPSQPLAVGLGPGLTAELNGTMGVCGELFATRIVLINLSGSAPVLLGGPVNTQLQTVTTLGINPSATSSPTPPPGTSVEITLAEAFPARLVHQATGWVAQKNGIQVDWKSSAAIPGVELAISEAGAAVGTAYLHATVSPGTQGASGVLAVAVNGVTYSLKIRGDLGSNNWTAWTPEVQIADPANLHSLRAFLSASGTDGHLGIRHLLSLPNPQGFVSLRSVMGIN